jgi:plasmid stabilization system protein ParE
MSQNRLGDYLEHIRNLIRREQADRYVDFLTSAFAELANSPKTAPACDHIRPGFRCWGVERHMVYFHVTDYGIAVIRALHAGWMPHAICDVQFEKHLVEIMMQSSI